MFRSLCHVVVLLTMLATCMANIRNISLPRRVQECYNKAGTVDVTDATFSEYCESLVRIDEKQDDYVFDEKEVKYFKSLYDISLELISDEDENKERNNRRKRQIGRPKCLRREYRMLTDEERSRFHNAINMLKQDTTLEPNLYDRIAYIHAKEATKRAHGGPGFPGWHRVYIRMFEAALQDKDPSVCLPYWDTSLDAVFRHPESSIIWTPEFLGTPNGQITEGPFANWTRPGHGPLLRDVGEDGQLLTSNDIQELLSHDRYEDMLRRMELKHNDIHKFCGGTMEYLARSPYDPTFFLIHAFVDYIWEQFRTKLRSIGVNPEIYPPVGDASTHHRRFALMGFPGSRYKQRDGYRNFFTQQLYHYEESPTCNATVPHCGSKYLICLVDRQQCVPLDLIEAAALKLSTTSTKTISSTTTASATTTAPTTAPHNASATTTTTTPTKVSTNAKTNVSTTATATMPTNTSTLPSASATVTTTAKSTASTTVTNSRPTTSKAASTSRRPSTTAIANVTTTPALTNFGLISMSSQSSTPSSSEEVPSSSSPNCKDNDRDRYEIFIQNDYCIDDICDSDLWVTLPVKIIHVRPSNINKIKSFTVHNGSIDKSTNIFSSSYNKTNRFNVSQVKTYTHCTDNNVGLIFLTSRGINYIGYHKETAILDNRLPVSMSMGFVNVRRPTEGKITKVLLRAHDSCGRMCHVACRDRVTGQNTNCDGAIAIDNKPPLMYGDSYHDAVMSIFDYELKGDWPNFKTDNFYITFYCDYQSYFPLQELSTPTS